MTPIRQVKVKRVDWFRVLADLKRAVTCPLQPYQSVGERPRGLQVN